MKHVVVGAGQVAERLTEGPRGAPDNRPTWRPVTCARDLPLDHVSAGGHDPDVKGAAPESRGVPAVENQEQERQLRPACQSAVQVGG